MSESHGPPLTVNDLRALLSWIAGRVAIAFLVLSAAFLVAAFVLVAVNGDYRIAIAVDLSLAAVCFVGAGLAAFIRDDPRLEQLEP